MTTQDAPLDHALIALASRITYADETGVVEDLDEALTELRAALAPSLDTPAPHRHEWPLLPNPTCMVIGCPGNEVEDWHEHCVTCGGINPALYERNDGPAPRDPAAQRLVEAARALTTDHHRYGHWRLPRRFKELAEALRHLEQEAGG